jgi:hypothetical protein
MDREALARALALDPDRNPSRPLPDRRRDPQRWFEAATSAAYGLQCDTFGSNRKR